MRLSGRSIITTTIKMNGDVRSFGRLCRRFERSDVVGGPAQEPIGSMRAPSPHEPVTKKRRIELVKSLRPAPKPLTAASATAKTVEMPPPKSKAVNQKKKTTKKAKTITEQATAPYAAQQQPTEVETLQLEASPRRPQKESMENEQPSGVHVHVVPKVPRKSRARRTDRVDVVPRTSRETTKRKSKKDEWPTTVVLLSPGSAWKQIEMQSVAFGTSSQLARDPESPTVRQEAAQVDASIDMGDGRTRSTIPAQGVRMAGTALDRWSSALTKKSLWSAAARDDQGQLAERSIDETTEARSRKRAASKQHESRQQSQPVPDVQHPHVTMPWSDDWLRIEDDDPLEMSPRSHAQEPNDEPWQMPNDEESMTDRPATHGRDAEDEPWPRREGNGLITAPSGSDMKPLKDVPDPGPWVGEDETSELQLESSSPEWKDRPRLRRKGSDSVMVQSESRDQRSKEKERHSPEDLGPAKVLPKSRSETSKASSLQPWTGEKPVDVPPESAQRSRDERPRRLEDVQPADQVSSGKSGQWVNEDKRWQPSVDRDLVEARNECRGEQWKVNGCSPDDVGLVRALPTSRAPQWNECERLQRLGDLDPVSRVKKKEKKDHVQGVKDEKEKEGHVQRVTGEKGQKSHAQRLKDEREKKDHVQRASEEERKNRVRRAKDEKGKKSHAQRVEDEKEKKDDVQRVNDEKGKKSHAQRVEDEKEKKDDVQRVNDEKGKKSHAQRVKDGEEKKDHAQRVNDEKGKKSHAQRVKDGEEKKDHAQRVKDGEEKKDDVQGAKDEKEKKDHGQRVNDEKGKRSTYHGPANGPPRDGGKGVKGKTRQVDEVGLLKAVQVTKSRVQGVEGKTRQVDEVDLLKAVQVTKSRVQGVEGKTRQVDEVDLLKAVQVTKSRVQGVEGKKRKVDEVDLLKAVEVAKSPVQGVEEDELWERLEDIELMGMAFKGHSPSTLEDVEPVNALQKSRAHGSMYEQSKRRENDGVMDVPCRTRQQSPLDDIVPANAPLKPVSSKVKKPRPERVAETVTTETDPPSISATPQGHALKSKSKDLLNASSDVEMDLPSSTIKKLRRKRLLETIVAETDPKPVVVSPKRPTKRSKMGQTLHQLSDEERKGSSSIITNRRLVEAVVAETDPVSVRSPSSRPIQKSKTDLPIMSSSDEELNLPSSTIKKSRRKRLLEAAATETVRLSIPPPAPASVPNSGKEPTRPAIHEGSSAKPNFEGYPTTKLSSTLASYGFKPVKSRTRMITLLEKCWEGQQRVALKALESNTQLAPPESSPPAQPRRLRETSKGCDPQISDVRPLASEPGHLAAADNSASIPIVDDNTTASKRPRGRPKKNTSAVPPAPVSSRDIERSRNNKDYVSESEPPSPAPLPTVLQPAPSEESSNSAAPAILPTSALEDITGPTSTTAETAAQQASRFASITHAIRHQPSSTSALSPTWHERILMYDPLVLEDLAVWLNTSGLGAVGVDFEVGPAEVKAWCQSKGVCCLWRENLRGGARRRR
ncbi:MAG: hypothetical protein M1823_004794 [Watsoniomyces obsoletus]|nr:MAG: hypothetical protein M1823_004794 [Watsoniomyces obsoletus]